MKKSKILYVLAFGSLLMSCGGTPSSSSTSTSSSQPTTNTQSLPRVFYQAHLVQAIVN